MSSSTLRRRRLMPAAPAAASLVVAGCASWPEVRADYDHSADFGKYRTYGPGLGYGGFYGAPWGGARVFDGYSFVAGQSARVALSRGTLQ